MAMGTSRALPMPKPALPFWSPTTTSAEKLRFLPPLTTLVTRWMDTTWSFKLFALTSIGRRTANVSRRICFDISLEVQSCLSGRIRQRLDAAMVLVAAPVEHNLLDTCGASPLGDNFANHFCGGHVAASLGQSARLLVERAGGNQRAPTLIVDDLRVNMAERTIHTQPRTGGGARDAAPNSPVNLFPMRIARQLANRLVGHDPCPFALRRGLGGARFARLLLETLARETDALLLVGIRRAQPANVGGDLPDLGAIRAADGQTRLLLDGDLNALGNRELNRV